MLMTGAFIEKPLEVCEAGLHLQQNWEEAHRSQVARAGVCRNQRLRP